MATFEPWLPHSVLYPPPWLLADSDGLQPECWNSIWNPPEWSESIIPPDSNGIQVEFHSNRFQWNPSGIPFQQIPSSFHRIPRAIPTHSKFILLDSNPFQPIPWAIPTHSNLFQPIPWAIPTHSNTFQVEFYSNGFQVPSKCHVT